MLEEMCSVIEQGETLNLRGFGSFMVRSKRERVGRNPKNGLKAAITPRLVVTFKASPVMIAKLNGLGPPKDDAAEQHSRGRNKGEARNFDSSSSPSQVLRNNNTWPER